MLYIIFLTAKCNLSCKYCGGSIDSTIMPSEVQYSINDLKKFIEKDEKAIIAFYGGEPLLRYDLMQEIIDEVEAEHYVLQTNGLLLKKVEKKYLKKLSTILVSIDGVKEVNDYYKGEVYDKVVENVEWLKSFYSGELIARMVATEKTDIFRDVTHLLNIFDYVHWQINAVWSPDELWEDFKSWVCRYNRGISKLVSWWLYTLEKGTIKKIVPFLGILKALIFEPNTSPPCGAGKTAFAITTDGKLTACPVCADFEWNIVGDIWRGIRKTVEIVEPCVSCEYSNVCGGRCLFFNRERLWGMEGFELVCKTCKHLINEMKNIKHRISNLFIEGKIDLREFYYPKFNNTTEIIP